KEIDSGWYAIAEIDQDVAKRLQHLLLAAAIWACLVALEACKHGRGDMELDRQFMVRDCGRGLVDLLLECLMIDGINGSMEPTDEKQLDHRMRGYQVDLKSRIRSDCAGFLEALENGIGGFRDLGIEQALKAQLHQLKARLDPITLASGSAFMHAEKFT